MLVDAISKFTDEAIRWNRMHFGNVFNRKKNIMARLNSIQGALANRPSNFLINLENELLKELEVVLSQEEEIWALKSQVNWLVQGDRNTNFYHVSTLVRRKRNQILAIRIQLVSGFLRKGLLRSTLGMGLRVFIPLLYPVLPKLPLLFPDGK